MRHMAAVPMGGRKEFQRNAGSDDLVLAYIDEFLLISLGVSFRENKKDCEIWAEGIEFAE